jgi:hypothetical protein
MMEGKGSVVGGWKSKLQATLAHVTPSEAVAECTGRYPNQASADRRKSLNGAKQETVQLVTYASLKTEEDEAD